MNITEITNEALHAFWAVVADAAPEAQSGDFPPDAAEEFERAARRAVVTWVEWNLQLYFCCDPDCPGEAYRASERGHRHPKEVTP